MKRCEQCCGNLWVLESDEIIFWGTIAEDIDAAIPNSALVNDGSTNRNIGINDDRYALVQQSEGVVVWFLCVKYYFFSACH